MDCGTGYSACYLARHHSAQIVGLDVDIHLLAQAQQRVVRTGQGARVRLVCADAHALPFPSNTFDLVLVESVLLSCQAPQVLAEIYRVLQPGGSCGVNELTLLDAAPAPLRHLLQRLGITPRLSNDWQCLFKESGLAPIQTQAHSLNLYQQLLSHLRVDGLWAYGRAVLRALASPTIRHTFFNREMLAVARLYRACVGYGLYLTTKPLQTDEVACWETEGGYCAQAPV